MKLRALALLCGILLAGSAQAQNPYPIRPPNYSPGYRPGLSPYLNLLRGGDPAANYYLGTRPEFQRRQNDRIFRSDLQRLANQLGTELEPEDQDLIGPRVTSGHPTAFGNTAGYFGSTTPPLQRKLPTAPPQKKTRGGR